ncbi:MAG: FkbM family methyltransferase [bacterium]
MKLDDLYKQYLSGGFEKHQYIDAMYEKHQALFDYFDYIKNTDIQTITIDNELIYVTIKGSNIKLLLDRYDRRFIPIEILNFHSFEPQERNLLFFIAGMCKTIFDIGANIGWYTLNFAKMSNAINVYAFEPIPHTYQYLEKHLKLNNITNVSAFNIGFSDTIEEKTFFWTKEENGSASMKNIQKRSSIDKVKCEITTLDYFMRDRYNTIDLIKCDVEGAELFVFKGGIETLKKYKPIIFSEILRKWSKEFGYHPNDIINLLRGIGYECYIIFNDKIKRFGYVDEDTIQTNYLFFHKEKHADMIKNLAIEKM